MKGWNRVDDLACVKCGATLISPKDSELMMCVSCLKDVQESAKRILQNKKNSHGFVKKGKLSVPPWMVTDRAKKKKK